MCRRDDLLRGALDVDKELIDEEDEADEGDKLDEADEVGDEDDDEGDPLEDRLC